MRRGRFQESMATHPVMHVSWDDADAHCRMGGEALADLGGVGEGGERRGRAPLSVGQPIAWTEPSQLFPHRLIRAGT